MAMQEVSGPVHREPGAGRQLTVITDAITIKASTAETRGAYALYEATTPPAGGRPPHTQRYDDATLFVLEGTYAVLVGEEHVDLGPGGYAFVPRGTPLAYTNPGDSPARMLMFVTPGGIHEQFLDEVGDRAGRAPWEPDVARLLAVAPKYGIAFQTADEPALPEPIQP